jgi:hypothetical protein
MIKDKLLDKKSICHALLYSTSSPEVMIPIKGIVEDIHFEEDIPRYTIKLIKFYDNIHFLKENFIGKPFLLKHKSKPKAFHIPKIRLVSELENWFIDECPHRFCIESTFVVRTKIEMTELFNKIEEYILIKHLRSIRDSSLRSLYEGPFKIQSKIEFKERLRRMYGDKFNGTDFDMYSDFI